MLLRSSSTPILGSLLSSNSESPNHGNHHYELNSLKNLPEKFSFHQTHTSPLHLITPSSFSNSSPSFNADVTSNCSQASGFRRVQSDGNLEGLLTSASSKGFDEFNHSIPPKFPRKPHCSALKTINSFSVYNPQRCFEDDDEQGGDEESGEEADDERSGNFTLKNSMAYMNNVSLQKRYVHYQDEGELVPSKMHLARGLGTITSGNGYKHGGRGNGGNNDGKQTGYGDDSGDGANMAEHYKKMVVDNPGNPMLLRNYAEFLHKSKDPHGAEEYYSRAILVDPRDGEILSQYARLTWELHHDEERTSSYFERAVQASPENSHVLAAYANFLWENDEEDDDDMLCATRPILHQSTTATTAMT